jgi:hypothetical protein
MKKIIINEYFDENLMILNENILHYSSSNNEVLSGGPPPSKFVDFSDVTIGHLGTDSDPFSYNDWQTFIVAGTGEVQFYCKGEHSGSGTGVLFRNGASQPNYFAWNPSVNGPWRLHFTNDINADAYLNNGILASDTLITTNNANDCYLSAESISFSGSLSRCLINCNDITQTTNSSVSRNCVIKANSGSIHELDYCAISFDITTTNPKTFCQIDWIAPVLPAWDAPITAFITSTLFADIDTPPEPGASDQSVFLDLWGNPKTGIGTGYMGPAIAVPPVWSSTYPKTGTIAQTTVQFLVKTDVSGNAYFVALPNNVTAPTSEQVKAGTNASDVSVAVGFSGTVVLAANVEANFSAINLVASTEYDIYFVAEDDSSNLQTVPVKLDVTTLAAIPVVPPQLLPINPLLSGHTLDGVIIAGNSESDLAEKKLHKINTTFKGLYFPNKRF